MDARRQQRKVSWRSWGRRAEELRALPECRETGTVQRLRVSLSVEAASMVRLAGKRSGLRPGMARVDFAQARSVRGRLRRRGTLRAMREFESRLP
jgi:hypothetical protein